MYLNHFIGFKLEQEFEDKYNLKVIQEVLDNKDKYPRIYPYIENEVEFDDNDKLIKKKYNFEYFEADDPEGCADYLDTMELYKAFVNVLLKDIRHKNIKIKSCTFGVDFLISPSVECIINPRLNYTGTSYVTVRENSKTFVKEIYEPNIIDGELYGNISCEAQINEYYEDNEALLEKLKENLFIIYDSNDLFTPHFKNEVLQNLKVKLK
ncbi:MAG: hypothetical protein J6Y42_00030, partial [Bacilli bacterium]|nr:hypothetical protein [Bacilli bacterium]